MNHSLNFERRFGSLHEVFPLGHLYLHLFDLMLKGFDGLFKGFQVSLVPDDDGLSLLLGDVLVAGLALK